jgi:hypothetical protein
MPPFGGAFAQQRSILSPIGQFLPVEGALRYVLSLLLLKEALIKSLSAFILGFLCNARNGTTRIASYLRSPMTKQCIKILIKADSMNESVLP